MKCMIHAYSVPVPYNNSANIPTHWPQIWGANSHGVQLTGAAQHQCDTHQWTFPIGAMPPDHGLCPIGRIEEATATAIAEIRNAQEGKAG